MFLLNAEQVRYLMRKLAADLKYLGLSRQRQELVKYILDQVDRFPYRPSQFTDSVAYLIDLVDEWDTAAESVVDL